MDINVLIPIAQGTEELEAITIVDLMRRAGIHVKLAGENEIVTCSRGTKLLPDILIDSIDDDADFDAIIIPGGSEGTINLMKSEKLQNLLQRHKQEDRLIGAICAGPSVLQNFKLLDKQASLTSHPSIKNQLMGFIYSEEKVVEDGTLITSRGAGTAIEFTLNLISRLCGDDVADRIADDIIYR